MIATKQKPFEEILESLEGEKKIFIVGCGDCASLCHTGGEEEVWEMEEKLVVEGKEVVGTVVIDVACHTLKVRSVFNELKEQIKQADGLLILACGAGVQSATQVTDKTVHPGLDSLFLANIRRHGEFMERCSMCGQCILDITRGICPVTRCAKGLINGPCGGAKDGKCEVDSQRDCGWVQIYERLKERGELDRLRRYQAPKDFQRTVKPGSLILELPKKGIAK
ncbi:MAG: 5,10-methylenetetrahydrofolate reductase [candidate division Zixibacteria bacterium SM23_81]|nr:MAG: 5,10-methylenetetrahydrofolate reductase [candidate division Zixibacteria bacterium SM23_81]